MFKINRNPTFSHKVKIRVPVDGGFADHEFTARFKHVPWSELSAVERDPAEQLRRVWIGWDGIANENGEALSYSDEAREMLIDMMFIRVPVLKAYVDAVTGVKRGN